MIAAAPQTPVKSARAFASLETSQPMHRRDQSQDHRCHQERGERLGQECSFEEQLLQIAVVAQARREGHTRTSGHPQGDQEQEHGGSDSQEQLSPDDVPWGFSEHGDEQRVTGVRRPSERQTPVTRSRAAETYVPLSGSTPGS
jgi:hypothetical protein